MILTTHRNLVSCLLFAILTFANTNGENQEGTSRTRNRSKRQTLHPKPRNCYQVLLNGETISGVYTIYPGDTHDGVNVYCDLQTDGGGWTVFLQRKLQDPQENFARTFDQYAQGFGNVNGEYWLGNNNLHAITLNTLFTLRVEAKNLEGEVRTAEWGSFSVGDEQSRFILSLEGYSKHSSSLGNALTPPDSAATINGMQFSTFDQDNDGWSGGDCSEWGKGGWWNNACGLSNPTGYLSKNPADNRVNWYFWDPTTEQVYTLLSAIEFKIRPILN